MGADRIRSSLESGEALRYETPLRDDGWLGVTDERLLVDRDDGVVAVPLENVREVTIQEMDWFLVLLSLALVAIGGYGVVRLGDVLLGSVFVAAGVVNLLLTYRKRGRVRLQMHTRSKPVTIYTDDTDAASRAIERALEPYRVDEPGRQQV